MKKVVVIITLICLMFGTLGIGAYAETSTMPIRVVAGGHYSFLIMDDGTVWGSGRNSQGQLGVSDRAQQEEFVKIEGLTDIVDIIAGSDHSVGLKSDGTVWAWGSNAAGRLGIGNTTEQSGIVQVSGLTNVKEIQENNGTLALKSDGTVWAWGSNAYGQVGIGNMIVQLSPVQTKNLTSVIAIAAGSASSYALKSDGTVWAWGRNNQGQLGIGNQTDQLTPVKISSLTNVIAIYAGGDHAFARKADGTIWAWGDNNLGVLGIGTEVDQLTPVKVSALTNITHISAGYWNTFAMESNGTVWGWGYTGYGQLSVGDNPEKYLSPIKIDAFTGAIDISQGVYQAIALLPDGTVWLCGADDYDKYKGRHLVPIKIWRDANHINKLTIDSYPSEIDQESKTITFTVPESALSNGRLEGIISDLDADGDSITFYIVGYGEYPNYQNGSFAGFSTGDQVYVNGSSNAYTLVIQTVQEPEPIEAYSFIQLEIGGTLRLGAVHSHEDMTFSWSSSDTSIVAVDNNGKITALNAGKAIINITSADGMLNSNFAIWVGDQDPSINLHVENISVQATTDTEITLAWDDVADAEFYEVQFDGNTLTSWTNQIAITGLTPDTQYQFIVRACTDEQTGAWSDPMIASTLPPAVPVNLALGATASANSEYNVNYKPTKAIDGDRTTATSRWMSVEADNSGYFQLDFDQEIEFNHIDIYQAGLRIGIFELQYWDGQGWVTFHSGTRLSPTTYSADFDPVTTSNVRLMIDSRFGTGGFSIYEFEIYKL